MSLVAFDTLEYSNKLKNAGADPKVADVLSEETAKVLKDLMEQKISTKDDLLKLEVKLQKFIVSCTTTAILILGGLQTLFHFIK